MAVQIQKVPVTKAGVTTYVNQKVVVPNAPKAAAPAQVTGNVASAGVPSDLYSWANEQTNLGNKLLESQRSQQEGLFKQFTTASQTQEPLSSAYTRLGTEAGVPELESTIGGFKTKIAGVQNMLNDLETNIASRIKGTDVSEAQRQRMVAAEGSDLTRQLSNLGTAMSPFTEQLTGAQSKIATQLGLLDKDQQKQLQPLIMQIDSVSDRFAREITMYNSQKETTLTTLLDKIERQRELDDKEWELTQTLAAEERAWARTKEQIALESSNRIKEAGSSGYSSDILNQILQKYGAGSQASSITPKRAGTSDNISYGGSTYTRENFASLMSNTNDRNSSSWKSAYSQILQEFPDYKGSGGGGW